MDLRATKNPELRWDERVTSSGNVLDALRAAVDFFSRHVGVEGVTLDGLSATAGTGDYVAMREALAAHFAPEYAVWRRLEATGEWAGARGTRLPGQS